MYLLPPSGEKWIYYTFLFFIYFFKDGLRNLYSLFYLKGIYITAINCILTYIIKIRKGVTFKQLVAQISHAHLSAHQQEKKRQYFLCRILLGGFTQTQMYWTSLRRIISFMHTSYVSAKRLHPFKGFAAIIANEAFPLGVDRLVPVQGACCDKSLSAYFTPVRSFARVCPDMSCEVGTVAETLLTHGATVRPLFILLAIAVVDVAGVERQIGLLQAAPQTGRR